MYCVGIHIPTTDRLTVAVVLSVVTVVFLPSLITFFFFSFGCKPRSWANR
jgi:hypothetical protein